MKLSNMFVSELLVGFRYWGSVIKRGKIDFLQRFLKTCS